MKKRMTALSIILASSMLMTTGGVYAAEQTNQGEALFPAYIKFKYGFINKEGKEVIAPKFSWVGEFSEGLAPAMADDGKIGFIDRTGAFVIGPVFDDFIKGFKQGQAQVMRGEDVISIDKTGKQVGPDLENVTTDETHEGMTAAKQGEQWGYLDAKGNWVIKPTYTMAGPFSEGLASVSLDGEKFGYIDKTGKIVIEAKFGYADQFSEGKAAVSVDGRTGFIDKKGAYVITPAFDYADDFNGGLAPVQTENEGTYTYGVINEKGSYVLKSELTQFPLIEEGLIYSGNKVFDKTGKVVLAVQGTINPFRDGLALVLLDDHASYVDRTGKVIWTESWDYPLQNGAKIVEKKKEVDLKNSYIYYPQLTGLKDQAVQAKINTLLQQGLAPDTEQSAEEEDLGDMSYTVSYRVMYDNKNTVNIIADSYTYFEGAAHGMPSSVSFVFNLDTGKEYKLDELFKPGSGYKEMINSYIAVEFKRQEYPMIADFETIDEYTSFYLTKNGLVIYFSPYEYTAYAAGFPEFELSYEELKPYLNEQTDFWKK